VNGKVAPAPIVQIGNESETVHLRIVATNKNKIFREENKSESVGARAKEEGEEAIRMVENEEWAGRGRKGRVRKGNSS